MVILNSELNNLLKVVSSGSLTMLENRGVDTNYILVGCLSQDIIAEQLNFGNGWMTVMARCMARQRTIANCPEGEVHMVKRMRPNTAPCGTPCLQQPASGKRLHCVNLNNNLLFVFTCHRYSLHMQRLAKVTFLQS